MESPLSKTPFKKVIIIDEEGNRKEIPAHKIIIETEKTEFEIDPEAEGLSVSCLKPAENNRYFDLCIRPFAANGVQISADQ